MLLLFRGQENAGIVGRRYLTMIQVGGMSLGVVGRRGWEVDYRGCA